MKTIVAITLLSLLALANTMPQCNLDAINSFLISRGHKLYEEIIIIAKYITKKEGGDIDAIPFKGILELPRRTLVEFLVKVIASHPELCNEKTYNDIVNPPKSILLEVEEFPYHGRTELELRNYLYNMDDKTLRAYAIAAEDFDNQKEGIKRLNGLRD
jgi:hypothetical protein